MMKHFSANESCWGPSVGLSALKRGIQSMCIRYQLTHGYDDHILSSINSWFFVGLRLKDRLYDISSNVCFDLQGQRQCPRCYCFTGLLLLGNRYVTHITGSNIVRTAHLCPDMWFFRPWIAIACCWKMRDKFNSSGSICSLSKKWIHLMVERE